MTATSVGDNPFLIKEFGGEMSKLVHVYRNAIVAQITTFYNEATQKNRSECVTHLTLKYMSYSSRRPRWILFLLDENKKLKLFAKDPKNFDKRCPVW